MSQGGQGSLVPRPHARSLDASQWLSQAPENWFLEYSLCTGLTLSVAGWTMVNRKRRDGADRSYSWGFSNPCVAAVECRSLCRPREERGFDWRRGPPGIRLWICSVWVCVCRVAIFPALPTTRTKQVASAKGARRTERLNERNGKPTVRDGHTGTRAQRYTRPGRSNQTVQGGNSDGRGRVRVYLAVAFKKQKRRKRITNGHSDSDGPGGGVGGRTTGWTAAEERCSARVSKSSSKEEEKKET
ncbi:hypothetical protein GGR56DRAFT_443971 [Xylariaceae sp. FL0804]|nr:hypothetical protein GGR56DRAFT_443971 [Xylariaceae sp. FL0804]